MSLKLGIIGLSEGNGHPYSWSAIFNGYNVKAMKKCGFPVIPEYLAEQRWPEAQISNARVTSVWTHEKKQSEHIAKASLIDNVASNMDDLALYQDAILLARDDAENHFEYAKKFITAGMPIYIDKPIALSISALEKLYQLQKYEGQIFTCSALRYSPDLLLSKLSRERIGEIVSISASTPKSWEKYAVHIIEPVLNILSVEDLPKKINKLNSSNETTVLEVEWQSGINTTFSALGNVIEPIKITIVGSNGSEELVFKNSFIAFKNALQDFIDGIVHNECRSPFEFNAKVVNLIEQGIK